MTVRQDIWQALHDAIGWQQTLVDAYNGEGPEADEARAQIERYRKILRRRYGTDKTKLDAMIEEADTVTVHPIRPTPMEE